MYCNNCHADDPRPNAIFCKICGFRLTAGDRTAETPERIPDAATKPAEVSSNKRCGKCGVPVQGLRRYCAACCGVSEPAAVPASAKSNPAPAPDIPPKAPKTEPTPTGAQEKPEVPSVAPDIETSPKVAEPLLQRNFADHPAAEIPLFEPMPSVAPDMDIVQNPLGPDPLGPSLGLVDEPLPELPPKPPRRHFQHWGLLMITMLLSLAALAAGGYYVTMFGQVPANPDSTSSAKAPDSRSAAAKAPVAQAEGPSQAVAMSQGASPAPAAAAPVAAMPASEARDGAKAQAGGSRKPTARPETAKNATTKAREVARARPQPYPAYRHDPETHSRVHEETRRAARMSPSPVVTPEPAQETPASLQTKVTNRDDDPGYLHRKEQELDQLLNQLH